MNSIIFRTTSRLLFPALIVLSIVLLYRGHNLPGGGFIGGLIAASAPVLILLSCGVTAASKSLKFSPEFYVALGLLTALTAALLPLASGLPFFTGLWLPGFEMPLLGKVHLGTPLLFDIGVYFTVIGFTVMCIFSLSELLE